MNRRMISIDRVILARIMGQHPLTARDKRRLRSPKAGPLRFMVRRYGFGGML